MSDQTTYSLAEIRNGTGWPEGVRFAVVPPCRYALSATFNTDRELTAEEFVTLRTNIAVQIDDPANADGDNADFSTWNLTIDLIPFPPEDNNG